MIITRKELEQRLIKAIAEMDGEELADLYNHEYSMQDKRLCKGSEVKNLGNDEFDLKFDK